MNNDITVLCINTRSIMKVTDEDKRIVDESFAELEEMKKKLAKNISRSNISELSKLSPRNILNLRK